MGFWKNETCEYCQGKIEEKTVDIPRKLGKEYILFKNVPAGVCHKCGIKYFAGNVLKLMTDKRRIKIISDKAMKLAVVNL